MESNGEIHKKASRDPTPDTLSNGLALEGEDSSSSSEDKFICGICNGKFKVPKVLHCLHAFCEACLEKSLEESGRTQLVCHTCKQITRLTMAGGVGELPIDAVIVNMMEMEAICSMQVICTSCKAQENAVARCSDCSNFLCSNCVTAHNYMRVFDSHKVETFDELKNGKGIHKPMYCIVHPTEHFKFYCRTCQVLTCAECMLYLHKQPDHHCERIVDIDRDQRAELKAIVTETKSKMSAFEDTSGKLESLLSDLQQQRDNAHDLIKETFQSFKATLEKRKDDLIKELEDIHSEKELTVMEMFHNLGKTVDKMEDACKFMERLVEHADAVEMMAVSKIVRAQMALLNDEVPRSDMSVKIEVESDPNKFAEATRQFFCAFKRPDSGNNAYQTAVNACGMLDPSSNPLNLPSELLSSLAANLTPPLLNDLASSIATSLPPNSNLSSLSQTLSFADRSLFYCFTFSNHLSPDLPLNGVFQVPPSSYPAQGPSSIRARSSGKTNSMEIRTKFGQLGPGKGQFNAPHGFCLGMDEDIVVADTNNHRIQVFDKSGEFKYQFGIPGLEEGQLWYPRKVAVIRTSGRYVVCDRGSERSRMQLFTRTGQFIKKIAIRYIDIVAGLAITSQGHIVAVDSVSPTVFCISESGELIKWFDCSDYMREPSDIAVSGKDYYVCDFKGHCVVVFNEDGQFLHRIGCETITNYPNGIDISDAGDVLIGDSHGNRFHVAVFQRDGSLIGEFECPYVKVSRCCGLKITSEGYIVTLAKNNQHVLVLNTLYIA
ncbi:hypothetical protein HELRODRAFT_111386 [Helobdella robusta]|uniref:Uncharacterized protein n=1 Tax=Helobdella robusta TaxID=6412 RepID=T1EFA8_HELRO|nr:hypothetical protein HELRODRAFT_111386 [Helobdella robusta]ESO04923.1 hypothetical protein HELRODRAFT_111386 [Helobdella robusta]